MSNNFIPTFFFEIVLIGYIFCKNVLFRISEHFNIKRVLMIYDCEGNGSVCADWKLWTAMDASP